MKWLVLVLLSPLIMLVAALLLNRPPLLAPPGALERLRIYLTTNVAETRPEHAFPELRTPIVPGDRARVHRAVLTAMRELGWADIHDAQGETRAVVISTLFRFRDDVSVRLEESERGTLLHARSASRLGKGDLAANSRHLQALLAAVERLVRDG